jgi:hypothetical protein
MYKPMVMKYLKSVNSYWDETTGLVYVCVSEECRDTDEGHPIKEMDEDWWDHLDGKDMARIYLNGGLV